MHHHLCRIDEMNCSHLDRQKATEEATLYQEEHAEVEEGSEEWQASLETIPIPPRFHSGGTWLSDERNCNVIFFCNLARQKATEEATLYQEEYAEV